MPRNIQAVEAESGLEPKTCLAPKAEAETVFLKGKEFDAA